jgi:RNA polymerase sigma factor (sigma-70 family)
MESALAREQLDDEQRALVEANLGLARAAVRHCWGLAQRLRHHSSWDDMVGVANLALCKAALRRDHARGKAFSVYAFTACRRAVLAELLDFRVVRLPPYLRHRPSAGHPLPSYDTLRSLRDRWCGLRRRGLVIAEAMPGPAENPADLAERAELLAAVADLPGQERLALRGYLDGLDDCEIADMMGRHRSRAGQCRRQALDRLRRRLCRLGLQ